MCGSHTRERHSRVRVPEGITDSTTEYRIHQLNMNSFGMKLASAVFLCAVATVHGWVPGPETNCTDPGTEPLAGGGSDYKSHHKYCNQFHRCVGGVRKDYDCPPNTLSTAETPWVCRGLDDSELKCANWPCVAAKPKARYPHPCREFFYECGADLKGYTLNTCPMGQHFDMTSETCVSGEGVDDKSCKRSVYNASSVCNLAPDTFGDPCKYVAKDGNISTTMECAEKTAFNQSSCGCSTVDESRCTRSLAKNNNKMPDNLCRASFIVTFDVFFTETGSPPRAHSIKTGQDLNDTIQVTGATFAGGIATLSSTVTSPAQLYVYSYNYNELTKFVGFVIFFRITGTGVSPVQLFANNFNEACTPTFYVTATLVGNVYTIIAYAKAIIKGTPTIIEDTVTVNLQVSQANSYVKVIFIPGMVLTLTAVDKGPTGTSTGTPVTKDGTVNYPAASILAYNKCGLTVCRGLSGDIAEFALHEGCRNTTILLNT